MKYNFEVIDKQQTPKVPSVSPDVAKYAKSHEAELVSFVQYISKLSHCDMTPIAMATNQVNLNGKRFMVRAFAAKDLTMGYGWNLIVDPAITKYSGIKELKVEGCPTWPGMAIVAERYRKIKATYYNVHTKKYENKEFSGLEAQVWQHEINHLNGVEERIEEKGYEVPEIVDPGRNAICPCGSNKKYKKCCIL